MNSFTKSDVGVYLGIYASIIATLTGLWALFHNIFRDRARVTVKVFQAYRVKVKDDPQWLIIRGEDTLRTMGITSAMRRPVLDVEIRNRGRRDIHIDDVAQARLGGSFKFGDLRNQVPFDLLAESRKTLILGAEGGYEHGDIRLKRFFAVDGAGRIHPLRERWRQRLARPVGAVVARRRRRASIG
jgi:hypothetical protein